MIIPCGRGSWMRIELFTLFPKKIFWEDNMISFLRFRNAVDPAGIITSKLHDQSSFYDSFVWDLRRARVLVVIESPFITQKRVNALLPVLRKLRQRGVVVIVNTKPIEEHDPVMADQAILAINELQSVGVKVLMTVGHHRKIAVVDDILWEGSLNILSQNDSCEFMRRIHSLSLTQEMLSFVGIRKWI
jgi:hypothetical protein